MVQSPRWVDMAVVIIVAVLVGVILVLLMSLTRPRRRFPDHHISKNHIRAIETAVRMYHRDFGAFPPDSTDMSSYGFVSSSPEALVYFLTTAFRKSPEPSQVAASVDAGPYLDLASKSKGTGLHGHLVFQDPNGKPYVYENNTDGHIGLAGGPHNRESFDIYSFGRNGIDEKGDGDDFTNWLK